MNTNRKGEETGGEQTITSASGDTVINKSTLCVQSGLKYNNNLCGKCPERDHYNTLHRVTRQQKF